MKFRSVILACISVLLLSSCSLFGSKDELSHFPVKLEKDERWSMIGSDGEILFQDEYEEVPTFVVNGVFVVLEGETYSVYRASEKPELIIDGLKGAGSMSDGLIPIVKKDSRITLIDKDGKEKFVLDSYEGKEIVKCDNRYSEGLLAVKTENNKWGYVNKDGEMVISPKYDDVRPFKGDYAIVYISKKDSYETSRYVINKKGETILEIKDRYQSNQVVDFNYGLMPVYDTAKDKVGFLNIKGEFISVPSKVAGISGFNDEVFVFWNKEFKYGLMSFDEENTQLIRPKYDYITIISSDEFLVKNDDTYYVVNSKDEKIINFSGCDFVMPSPITAKLCYIAKEGKVSALLDKEGKQLGNVEFYAFYADKFDYYEGDGCYDWYVHSDYFNPQSVNKVIEDCFATYVLGESMAKYVTNPEVCDLNISYYSVPNSDEKGSVNNICVVLESDLPYIKYSYNAKAINANSKLKGVNLELYSLGGCDVFVHSEKIDKQLTNILESKGFKKEADREFVKDDVRVSMALTHDSGYLIRIFKDKTTTGYSALYSGWGEIANVRCRIELDLASGTGTLSYDTKGSKPFSLKVSEYSDYGGVKTYDGLTVEEYDYNGTHSSTYS